MSGVVSASAPTVSTLVQPKLQNSQSCYWFQSSSVVAVPCKPSHGHGHTRLFTGDAKWSQRTKIQCQSSTGPGGSNPGESDSRGVLDAFFLGKALAEALNERIESAVGEFLSTVGRLQAEQQRQIQDLQEEVLERAKKAKEKAAREAMEAQGLVPKPKSRTVDVSVEAEGVSSANSSSAIDTVTPANSSSSSSTTNPTADSDPTIRVVGVSNDD